MNRRPTASRPFLLRVLPRVALLTVALFVPMIAMHSVQAGSQSIIESSHKVSNGAGLVLLASLQRN